MSIELSTKGSMLCAQVSDGQARQAAAEEAAAGSRAELLQLSRELAAAGEEAAMWQGRAEGLQQQVQGLQQQHQQAMLSAQQLKLGYDEVSTAAAADQHNIRQACC